MHRVRLLIAVAALASLVGCQSSPSTGAASASKWNHYGDQAAAAGASQPLALGTLKGDERNVTVSGVITEVCQHQGCWIRLKDPSNPQAGDLFVKTTDHAYLVPRNSPGRRAIVVGTCEYSEMSVADQKHYAEEAGKTAEEIAKITQPKKMITFHADSISIEGEGLDKPLDQ